MQNSFRDRFLPLLFAALLLVCHPFSQYPHCGAPGRLFCPTAAGAEEEWEDEEPSEEELEAMRRASDVGDWGEAFPDEDRQWTLLVYLGGDNNLEGNALVDLVEMQIGMANIEDPNAVEVIVLLDRAEGYVDWDGDWKGARVYRVFPSENTDDIDQEVLHDCGELNMGSPQTLENFIAEGMRVYPAPRTALILWNHGGGWAGLMSDDNAPGEEGGSGEMTLEDMRLALSRAAVHFPDGKLDLLALDMCLMGQAETLVAVAPYAKYLVASPPLEPGFGYDYTGMLPYFADGLDTRNAAIGVVRTASQVYRNVGWHDASLAVYDLSKVGGLLSSFGALARKMDTLVPIAWSHLTRSLFHALRFGGRNDLYRRFGTATTSSIDILDWLDRLKAISDPMLAKEFTAETEAVRQALSEIVVYTESGPLMKNSTGLAVYAPLREDNYDGDYLGNAFGAYTDWAQALTDLHVEQKDNAGSPPRILSIEFGALDGKEITPSATVRIEEDRVKPEGDERFVKTVVNGTNIMWVHAGFAISTSDDPDGTYVNVLRKTVLNSEIIVPAEETSRMSPADDQLPVFREGRNEFVHELTPCLTWLQSGAGRTVVYPQYSNAANPEEAVVFGQMKGARVKDDVWHPAVLFFNEGKIASIELMVEDNAGNFFSTLVLPEPGDVFRPFLTFHTDEGEMFEDTGDEIVWDENTLLVNAWPQEGRYIKILCMAESLAGEGAQMFSAPIAIDWIGKNSFGFDEGEMHEKEETEEEYEEEEDGSGNLWSDFLNQW